jgi:hypothetical protein
MFFVSRYKNKYGEFEQAVQEIKGWSYLPSKKNVAARLDRYLILDPELRNCLLAKISYIFENKDVFLDLNVVDEINLFFYRKMGISEKVINDRMLDVESILNNFTDSIPLLNEEHYTIYNDIKLLTLVEVLVVFLHDNKTKKIIGEFGELFVSSNLFFENGLIFFDSLPDLQYKLHLFIDEGLKDILGRFYFSKQEKDYVEMSKNIAEAIKRVFISSNLKKEDVIEVIISNIYIFSGGRSGDNKIVRDELDQRYNYVIKIIDKVYNVRHTETWTISVRDGYVYKYIAHTCLDFLTIYINANTKKYIKKAVPPKKIKEKYYAEFIKTISAEEDIIVPF